MNILVACEFSGVVRDAFRRRGHFAMSCDLRPDAAGSPYHLRMDVRDVLDGYRRPGAIDLVIAHPPCTFLSVSGLHWNARRPERAAQTEAGIDFARMFFDFAAQTGCRMAIENPVGILSTRIRKPDQTIQPYQFGADASKRTCLWLQNLPALVPTRRIPGRRVTLPDGRTVERWSNQTDSGQNRLGPSPEREALRSMTYPGIADAMAEQWGSL